MELKKPFLIAAGFVCISFAVLGILLPGLPTTPFLLLALYCFAKSSQKLHSWLLNHKIFGFFIRDFQKHKSIPFKIKAFSLIMMWSMVLYAVLKVISATFPKILVILLAIIGTYVVGYHIPTRK